MCKFISSPVYRRSWLRRYGSNEVVYGLIIANTAVFMLWRIADRKFMMNNFTVSPSVRFNPILKNMVFVCGPLLYCQGALSFKVLDPGINPETISFSIVIIAIFSCV